MYSTERVIHESYDVESRLRELGLTSRIFRESIEAGELENLSSSALDAPSFPGLLRWGHTFRRLAELTVQTGWRRQNKKNMAAVVNPEDGMAIVVSTGNDATGRWNRFPTTKSDKGCALFDQVNENIRQGNLFLESRFRQTPAPSEWKTWIYLIHSEYSPWNESEGEHVAYSELSFPISMDEKGYIDAWQERIVLDRVRLDLPSELSPPQLNDEDDEIDIQISRRN